MCRARTSGSRTLGTWATPTYRASVLPEAKMRLTDFKVLTFDCYGTLIDWESGMVEALRSLTDRVDRPLTRNEILEAHAFHESTQQRQTPAKRYRDLLAIVYKRVAEQWGVSVTH